MSLGVPIFWQRFPDQVQRTAQFIARMCRETNTECAKRMKKNNIKTSMAFQDAYEMNMVSGSFGREGEDMSKRCAKQCFQDRLGHLCVRSDSESPWF